MKKAYSVMVAVALALPNIVIADEATEQAIRDKYDAKFAELKKRSEATQAQFQQRADNLSKEAKTPFKLDMTVNWKKRDMSLHLPQTTMKTKKMSLDLPTTKWGMMHIGPLHTKGPVFKMERRDFSLDLPEFRWARSNMVMTIPEFTVHEAHFLVPVNSSEIKEKGTKLETDARAEFAKLQREYWNLNAAQQDELVAAATGAPASPSGRPEDASSRLIKSYDNAIAKIDAAIKANHEAQGGLLTADELKQLTADRAEIIGERAQALKESKEAFTEFAAAEATPATTPR